MKSKSKPKTEKATFAAGCFWGIEAAFKQVSGVKSTEVGYTGGTMKKPAYEDVCKGETGHAEAVLVEFDPKQVSYEQLLEVFWKIHDPTTYNRQGPDIGSQYRSAIFFHSESQKNVVLESKKKAQKNFSRQIVTDVVAASTFYPAEEYHQDYYRKHGKVCKIKI